MSRLREAYVQAREALLEHIATTLKNDERFVAAWLAGSFGRGEQTWLSDLDIHVVVADAYSELGGYVPSSPRTMVEMRLALLS